MRDFTRPHDRARHTAVTILAVVVAITAGSLFTGRGEPARVIAAGAAAPVPGAAVDPIRRLLTRQAAALDAGDLAGWLAPVDPPMRPHYRNLFRTLRALHATVEYHENRDMAYCFVRPRCPADSPLVAQRPIVKKAGPSYVISGVARTDREPTPWENGDLIFFQGGRVTVGAPKSLRAKAAEIAEIAEKAAAVDDRYAAYVDNRQPRYRVFLATGKLWRTWYGGKATDWAVGYMQPIGPAGGDVVINPSRLTSRTALREVIQHELGHVATISGVQTRHEDMWLVEGVAEYIGMQPRRAPDTYSRDALRRPERLDAPPLRDGAGEKEVAAFYAQGHFAVDCLVRKFGEPRAMEFIRLRLRLGNSLDIAARSVFGQPFTKVDESCRDWISNLVVTRK